MTSECSHCPKVYDEKPQVPTVSHIPRVWAPGLLGQKGQAGPAVRRAGLENESSCFPTSSGVLKKPVSSTSGFGFRGSRLGSMWEPGWRWSWSLSGLEWLCCWSSGHRCCWATLTLRTVARVPSRRESDLPTSGGTSLENDR